LLENFCKREEAPHYKDFGAAAKVQTLSFSGGCEFVFGGPAFYFGHRSAFEKSAAPFCAARRNLATIEQDCCHS
jgi:hypothetical protein